MSSLDLHESELTVAIDKEKVPFAQAIEKARRTVATMNIDGQKNRKELAVLYEGLSRMVTVQRDLLDSALGVKNGKGLKELTEILSQLDRDLEA